MRGCIVVPPTWHVIPMLKPGWLRIGGNAIFFGPMRTCSFSVETPSVEPPSVLSGPRRLSGVVPPSEPPSFELPSVLSDPGILPGVVPPSEPPSFEPPSVPRPSHLRSRPSRHHLNRRPYRQSPGYFRVESRHLRNHHHSSRRPSRHLRNHHYLSLRPSRHFRNHHHSSRRPSRHLRRTIII